MGEHFVLIHGAWHGGWCWEGVIAALEKAGHTAEAPTMPGMAPGDDRAAVTFDDYVEAITSVLEKQPAPVVLVGHSSAGFLLQAAAPKAANKVKRAVFLNAFVLPDGACQFDLVPPDAAAGLTGAANASPDKSVPVIEDMVRGMLMGGDTKEDLRTLFSGAYPRNRWSSSRRRSTQSRSPRSTSPRPWSSPRATRPFHPAPFWAWRRGWARSISSRSTGVMNSWWYSRKPWPPRWFKRSQGNSLQEPTEPVLV